jgi:hypothetical protein
LRTRSHYIDVAGLTLVREGMMPHDRELSALGLVCVVSAGWLPGMTELLPTYSLALSRTRMDSIHSVTMFSMSCLPEVAEFIGRFKSYDGRAYTNLASRWTAVVGSLIALLPLSRDFAIRKIGLALLAESLPVVVLVSLRFRVASRAERSHIAIK